MQQFTIPQFIDVEDKIIGPITTRQFVIMLVGFLLIGVCYKIFDFSLFVTVGLAIFAVSGAFAFVKINGRPFHFFLLNLVQTSKKAKLRVWNNAFDKFEVEYEAAEVALLAPPPPKHYAASRLAELSLIVDTRGAYGGEKRGDEAEIKSA